MIILFTFICLYFIVPHIIRNIIRSKSKINFNDNEIQLSFDDGPNPEATPLILDLLKESNTKATFFLLGENIENYPLIVEKIINDGHRIGDHSFSHLHPWKTDPFTYLIDLLKGNKLINNVANPSIHEKILFRPPFGKFNIITIFYILFTNRKVVFWDIDPKDYIKTSGQDVVNFVKKNTEIVNPVILLHDNRINEHSSGLSVTVDATRELLKGYNKLQSRNIKL